MSRVIASNESRSASTAGRNDLFGFPYADPGKPPLPPQHLQHKGTVGPGLSQTHAPGGQTRSPLRTSVVPVSKAIHVQRTIGLVAGADTHWFPTSSTPNTAEDGSEGAFKSDLNSAFINESEEASDTESSTTDSDIITSTWSASSEENEPDHPNSERDTDRLHPQVGPGRELIGAIRSDDSSSGFIAFTKARRGHPERGQSPQPPERQHTIVDPGLRERSYSLPNMSLVPLTPQEASVQRRLRDCECTEREDTFAFDELYSN